MNATPDTGGHPTLLAYLRDYAAGHIDRDQMIDTVAAWPLHDTDPVDGDPTDHLPDLDENSTAVLAAAVTTFGWITEPDYAQIARRRQATPPDTPGTP
ncbi:MAG TPA: hypothetical protein VFX70_09780 [Mycobacteriales bacterium]|nr:hypothetical protein [Mycobacteriales bacterium]